MDRGAWGLQSTGPQSRTRLGTAATAVERGAWSQIPEQARDRLPYSAAQDAACPPPPTPGPGGTPLLFCFLPTPGISLLSKEP